MTENLTGLLRALEEIEAAAMEVARNGWKKAAALETSLQQNQHHLGTGRELSDQDDRKEAQEIAILRARVYREAYQEALERSDQPVFQTVAVGHAKLLADALADLRKLISIH